MTRKKSPDQMPDPEMEPLEEHDPLDIEIIKLLQEDGRMAFSRIAKQLEVSEGTIRNRVKQLLDENMIAIEAQSFPKAFGYHWNSITFLNVSAGSDIDTVAKRFSAISEAYYVVLMTGRFDLGVAAYHKSEDHFRQFLVEHCYGQADISHVESNINLHVYKFKTKWRIRE